MGRNRKFSQNSKKAVIATHIGTLMQNLRKATEPSSALTASLVYLPQIESLKNLARCAHDGFHKHQAPLM